jgi:hypothetical protein
MFVQEDFYQSDPNVVVHIMTQLTQERLELKAMGRQSVCGGDVGDEATTFL